jgi:protein-S-isoprenylcysteine O-methyltransferase Ste14
MEKKMSLMGIGPKLFLVTILYVIILIFLNNRILPGLRIIFVPYHFLLYTGIFLILTGLTMLIPSGLALSKLKTSEVLYTKGVFSICRHPLYSAWIVFIIPGVTLMTASWLMLSIPLFMYIFFRIFIREEETYLANTFGEQYKAYKNKTGLLFPRFWKYQK